MGTIIKHLEGNVRQWILSGIGGEPDARERSGEFSNEYRVEASGERTVLLDRLKATTGAAAELLASLQEDSMQADFVIQGFDVTGLEATYHVVEHFSLLMQSYNMVCNMRINGLIKAKKLLQLQAKLRECQNLIAFV